MAYAAGTIKIVISGRMPNGTNFAMGFQTMVNGAPTQDNVDAACGYVSQALASNVFAPILNIMSPDTVIEKVNAYGYNGGTKASVVGEATAGNPGTASGQTMPSQVAVVASFRSASNTRAGRGRAYMPATGVTLASGQLSAGECTLLANAWVSLFDGFATQSQTGMPQTPVVGSAKEGESRTIVAVIVDSRPDIIRHRAQGENVLYSHRAAV